MSRTTPFARLFVLALGIAAFAAGCSAPGSLTVGDLRCERLRDPLGIDARAPALSWVLRSGERGARQDAYRIVAASSREALERDEGDLWDSGQVRSAESVEVLWGGKPPRSRQEVHWKVRAWDGKGKPSEWSPPARFEMGLLEPVDWTARWIAMDRPRPARDEEFYADRPAPLLRKEFTLSKDVARARLYATGLGFHEVRMNGNKVGDALLDPPWTDVRKRVFYAVHDVTPLLVKGANAIGAMLGSGWYDPLPLRMWGHLNLREHLAVGEPRMILQLEVEYADGTRETVASDGTWKAAGGPIIRDSVYLGETYDARLERPGWDSPGHDERDWTPVRAVDGPNGALRTRPIPPVVRASDWQGGETRMTEPVPGTYIFDAGMNRTGRAVLRVRGPAGTRIVLRHGELLRPDGTLNPLTSVCGQIKGPGAGGPGAPDVAIQTDTYILKGDGEEVWAPRFTFHGFRYVEVTGYPGRPEHDAIQFEDLFTYLEPGGLFASSSDLLNRILAAVDRTFRSNLLGVQSDCPHREKFGYGGDIVATSEAFMYRIDMATFYEKTVRDFSDAARPDGGLTETAPFVGISDGGLGEGWGPIGWGTAHPLLLDGLRRFYGHRRLIEEEYGTAARWVDAVAARAKDGIIAAGIGDHESLEPQPMELIGTAFLAWNARLAAGLARALGKAGDAERFDALARSTAEAFRRKFVDPATGRVGPGTQTAQSFALALDLLPQELRPKALEVLAADVAAHGDHLTTGIFGTKFLLDALSAEGRLDLAAGIAGQKTFPGWGHMLERGATTLWEHWEWSDDTYSHNHPMFGSIAEWFFERVAGIRPAADAVGFDRIIIAPGVSTGLAGAMAAYVSIRGVVSCNWIRAGSALSLNAEIPVGAAAEVHIPAASPDGVLEGGRPASLAEGVRFLRWERGEAVFAVASGRYEFRSSLESS